MANVVEPPDVAQPRVVEEVKGAQVSGERRHQRSEPALLTAECLLAPSIAVPSHKLYDSARRRRLQLLQPQLGQGSSCKSIMGSETIKQPPIRARPQTFKIKKIQKDKRPVAIEIPSLQAKSLVMAGPLGHERVKSQDEIKKLQMIDGKDVDAAPSGDLFMEKSGTIAAQTASGRRESKPKNAHQAPKSQHRPTGLLPSAAQQQEEALLEKKEHKMLEQPSKRTLLNVGSSSQKSDILRRSNSYHAGSHSGPIGGDASRLSKLQAIDENNKKLLGILEQFGSSPRQQKAIAKQVLSKIDARQRGRAPKKAFDLVDDGGEQLEKDQEVGQMSQNLEYSGRIEQLLNILGAAQPEDFKEAENYLKDAALVDGMDGRDQPTRTKKSVTFKIRADEEAPMMQLYVNQKPPLAQSKQRLIDGGLGAHGPNPKSQSVNQPQSLPEANQRGHGGAPAGEACGDPEEAQPRDPRYGLINEILELTSAPDGGQGHLTSSRKLLAYLQSKMLVDQRGPEVTLQAAGEKDRIEKELQNDLNYLNVFVQPIGSINIFSQERQEQLEQAEMKNRQHQPPDLESQLASLIRQSPLKDVVDERVLQLLNRPTRAEAGQVCGSGSTAQLRLRALGEVLDAILEGGVRKESSIGTKETAKAESKGLLQIKAAIIEQILPHRRPSDPRLGKKHKNEPNPQVLADKGNQYQEGLDVAGNLAYPRGRESLRPDLRDDSLAELFDLSDIQAYRDQLHQLLQHGLDADEEELPAGRVMTFLTEQFPPRQEDLSRHQRGSNAKGDQGLREMCQTKSKQRALVEQAKKLTNEQASANQAEIGRINSEQDRRLQLIEDILKKLDLSQEVAFDVSTAFMLTQTEKQRLTYLCFVECTRQIAKHSRAQAVLLLKIWQEYFGQAQAEVRNAAATLHQEIDEIAKTIKSLVDRVREELQNRLAKDVNVLELKHDFHKTLEVLETLTRSLYQEEARSTALELKLKNLEDGLALVYPNYQEYLVMKQPADTESRQASQERAMVSVQDGGIPESKEQHRAPVEDQDPSTHRPSRAEEQAALRSRITQMLGAYIKSTATSTNKAKRDAGRIGGHSTAAAPSKDTIRPSETAVNENEAGLHDMNHVKVQQQNHGQPADGSESRITQEPKAEGQEQTQDGQATKPAVSERSIYDLLVSDIERMVQVLPIKTQAQRELEAAQEQIQDLKAKLARNEKAIAKQEKELIELRDRGTELVTELVEQQTAYGMQIQTLKAAVTRRVEEVRRLEAEKLANEQAKGAKKRTEGTQTLLDGESEAILQQQEFSQRLRKFRAINRTPNINKSKITKVQEESYLEGTPPIENVYLPITDILRIIKAGKSKHSSDMKSVKNVLKMLADLFSRKIAAAGKSSDNSSIMNLDQFFYHNMCQTYGMDQLANKYCEIYLLSIDHQRKKDARLELFRRFVGLDSDKLPPSIFEKYITMMKATGIQPANLFTQPLSSLFVDYNRVRYTLRDLLKGANDFTVLECFRQLKKFTRVVTDNAALLKRLEPEDYEVLKDLQEQIIRSSYKSTANMLRTLFAEEEKSSEEDESESEESDDADKVEKTVTLAEFANFLMSNFDLTDYTRGTSNLLVSRTAKRVQSMLEAYLVVGSSIDPQRLTQSKLTRAFRERVELRVPVAAYFSIGINSCVDHENSENQVFESAFQFYSQMEVEVDASTGNMVTKDVRVDLNLEGMAFQQFVLFLKDTGNSMVAGTERQAAFDVYRAACELKQRQRLSCEDFIETIRKHHLYPSQSKLLLAMQRREAEIALFVRQDLLARGQAVPAEIEEVYQAMAAAADAGADAETSVIGTKKKARLQDLNKLASSVDSPTTATKTKQKSQAMTKEQMTDYLTSKVKANNASSTPKQDQAKIATGPAPNQQMAGAAASKTQLQARTAAQYIQQSAQAQRQAYRDPAEDPEESANRQVLHDANKAFVLAGPAGSHSQSVESASRRSDGQQDSEEEDENESQPDDQADRLAGESSQNNESELADDE